MPNYALRILAPGQFQLAKFDAEMNVEAVYSLVAKGIGYSCDCPANYKSKLKPCKHQRMMPYMMGAANLPRFYDPDTGKWAGLLDVAPGMKLEHEEGEALVEGKNRTATEINDAINKHQGLALADAVLLEPLIDETLKAVQVQKGVAQPELDDTEQQIREMPDGLEKDEAIGEPATPTPVAEPPAPSPPERSMAPASAAPVVTRRI